MTQTENTQPLCEFHTQGILVPTGLALGVGWGHNLDLTAPNLKAS